MYTLYTHPSLCKTPDWWKVGVAITPYSAVRVRQRFMVSTFEIPYLWFGKTSDIHDLEKAIISNFPTPTGGRGNTELVNCTIDDLLHYIQEWIAGKHSNCNIFFSDRDALDIIQLPLTVPYTATNSSDCPFGFPSEKNIHEWAKKECDNFFGRKTSPSMIYTHIANQQRIAKQKAEQDDRFLEFFGFN